MVKVKKRKEVSFVSKEYEGSIEELPFKEYVDDLKKWAKKKKAKPYGKTTVFYQNNFDKAFDDDFRADVCLPIKNRKKGGGGYKLKFLPSIQVVAKKFQGTPADYPKAYEEIFNYIDEKGYKAFGQRMEKFKKIPEKEGGEYQIKSELQVPVEIPSKK